MNYCQDGLLVFFKSNTQEYTNHQLYGHYTPQPFDINGRAYFIMPPYGFWWDAIDSWRIGFDPFFEIAGQPMGIATHTKDVFCPTVLTEDTEWILFDGNWYPAENNLLITC